MDQPESEPEYSRQTDYQPFTENVSDHSDGEDRTDEHLNLLQQQVEAEQTFEEQHHTQPSERACAQSLCPPKDGAKYLVEKDSEEPVKSKPHKRKKEEHQPPLSSSDTSDSDSSDRVKRKATVADDRPKSGSTSSSSSTYSGDVDTASEPDNPRYPAISPGNSKAPNVVYDTHTITGWEHHATLCKAISMPHKRRKKSYIPMHPLKLPKTRVIVLPVVNCRGDMNQRCATLEATVNFPRSRRSSVCTKILEECSCKVKLTIAVYGGKTKEGSPLICTKSVEKDLLPAERDVRKMKIIVPEVVNMDVFVLPEKPEECPDCFCFEITTSVEARKIEIRTEDSGCDDFVEVSTSVASAER